MTRFVKFNASVNNLLKKEIRDSSKEISNIGPGSAASKKDWKLKKTPPPKKDPVLVNLKKNERRRKTRAAAKAAQAATSPLPSSTTSPTPVAAPVFLQNFKTRVTNQLNNPGKFTSAIAAWGGHPIQRELDTSATIQGLDKLINLFKDPAYINSQRPPANSNQNYTYFSLKDNNSKKAFLDTIEASDPDARRRVEAAIERHEELKKTPFIIHGQMDNRDIGLLYIGDSIWAYTKNDNIQ